MDVEYYNLFQRVRYSEVPLLVLKFFTAAVLCVIQSSNTVTVAVRQCPAGYLLLRSPSDELTFTCQCNPNNSDIMSCDDRRIQLTVSAMEDVVLSYSI